MGIDNLNGLLREKCPQVFVQRLLTDFTGKAIAIDGNGWFYKLMSVQHRRNVNATDISLADPNREVTVKASHAAALESLIVFLSYGITPFVIFDGKHPASKLKTQTDRRTKKEEAYQKLDVLRQDFAKMDLLARDGKRIEEMRKLLCQCNSVSKTEFEYFRGLLKAIGIPCIQAEGEAEELCSCFCRQGKVAAVFSTDTDNLVYGCPCIINEFSDYYYDSATHTKIHTVTTVGIVNVLKGLNMSYSSFVDLCIMLGCDYNGNIPQIGMTRAFSIISKFGSIDRIPRHPSNPNLILPEACQCRLPKTNEYDITILNAEECRSLFRPRPIEEAIGVFPEDKNKSDKSSPLEVPRDLPENARDALTMADLSRYIPRLATLYRQLPKPAQHEPIDLSNCLDLKVKPKLRLSIVSDPNEPSTSSSRNTTSSSTTSSTTLSSLSPTAPSTTLSSLSPTTSSTTSSSLSPISSQPTTVLRPVSEPQLRIFGDTTIPILSNSSGRLLTLT